MGHNDHAEDPIAEHVKDVFSVHEKSKELLPAEGEPAQLDLMYAREQTAALLTTLTTLHPLLVEINSGLIETNARLDHIQMMLRDLWAAHS